MSCVSLTKIPIWFPTDDSLTVSIGNHPLSIVEGDITLDLTLNKGIHLSGKRGSKVIDLSMDAQRRYFKNIISDIIYRFNANPFETVTDSILSAFTVFEVQQNTGCVHCHSNIKISIGSSASFAIARLKDIVKSFGFKPQGYYIEYIKYPEQRMAYILKRDTKVPDHAIYYQTTTP